MNSQLFEFELAPIERIERWGTGEDRSLSWFALTDGRFRMPVGDQVLFEYTDAITEHWGPMLKPHVHQDAAFERAADYQIASFARTFLEAAAAGAAPLPVKVERLAANWSQLRAFRQRAALDDDDDDLWSFAWRWLGERSPWTSYLVAGPNIQLVRIGDEVRIHWDNRDRVVDEHPVWTADVGVQAMPVESFIKECRSFAERLLLAMNERIAMVEAGTAQAQIPLNADSLRAQHETWRAEFESYF